MKRALFRLCVNGSMVVAAISCGDQPTSPWPSPPARDSSGTPTPGPNPAASGHLQILGGNDQLTIPRGALPQPLVVRAMDAGGRPRAGVLVHWQADGGSRFETDTARTAANGVASARWIMAASNSTYHATARLDTTTAANFTARADSVAVTVEVVPDTIRFASLGDTAWVRVRITTNGQVSYTGIRSWGYQGPQAVVDFGGGTERGLRVEAIGNGSVTVSTWYGDVQFYFTVVVRQVSVGTRIVLRDRGSVSLDTLAIGPDDPTPLAVRSVDARGNPLVDSAKAQRPVWRSSDDAFVTVDSTGVARGVTDGVATVSARTGTDSLSAALRVWTLHAAEIAASSNQTCARLVSSEIACWGFREGPTLNAPGDLTMVPELLPFGTFTSIAVSEAHACGLRGQTAWCWGANNAGQIGTGTSGDTVRAPVAVTGGLSFAAMRVGAVQSCGLTTSGRAYCWGSGADGALGSGSYGSATCSVYGDPCSLTPVAVAGDHTFAQISVGSGHVCALTPDGQAWCWGSNWSGQLGVPRTRCAGWPGGQPNDSWCSTVPIPAAGAIRFRQISAGGGYTCGAALDGTAYCWGTNYMGQLGDSATAGSLGPHEAPIPVSTSVRFSAVYTREFHTCGIATDGSAYCWGPNPGGVLGNGVEGRSSACRNGFPCDPVPVLVSGGLQFRSLAVGFWHTCGMTTADVVYCWGDNYSGAIGDGRLGTRPAPVPALYQRR